MAINNTVDYKKLDLKNVGKPKTPGITNLNLVPEAVRKNASLSPAKKTQAVQSPARAPVAPLATAPSSAGSYKGVNITSGSDADIAEQMRRIDQGSAAPVKGLLPSVKESIKVTATEPVPAAPKSPAYGGLVQTLSERAQTPSKEVADAFAAQQGRAAALRKFRESTAETTRGVYSAPTSARVMQGRDQALQAANMQREAALASELTAATDLYSAALTGQGQQLTALGTAAGLAQPSVAAFGQTVFNPLTGQYEGGSGGAGQPNVPSLAQQVVNGQLTPSQAESMLGNNLGLVSQLNQAVLGLNPNFDRVQAEAQAGARSADITQTGQAGGQVSKAAVSANQALDTLQNAYSQLGTLTGATGIPIFNQIAQNVALQTGLGREAVSGYVGALNEARAQLRSVLGSSGVNDLAAGGIVDSLLPDNMTPQEVPQKIQAAKDYIQKRVEALTTPGVVGGTQQTGGGAGAVQAGGYQFVQDASGKWVPAQ
jgi:phosphoribosylcarboxyaminoimidazole (NCAIR) mutase